ncbi:unnamed protein product (macronuclear) [Paramecium tetraurelia]|uniref:Shugoshin C-terminal domain-containing protein n=1 Tax=Paramecium tetraurelia TaxID=5888 RepID=A0E9J6_PARTE|nr:uncharacterized protein GSPATT00024694001 [Paramecium tetraurelia]CAK91963.1 unnamed protein product [Paramecium tetraurelia]|eukprot:XP_001459360.1 hypothetical protein (macronuclear) [Paramecium tetraurelia strain d4-2]
MRNNSQQKESISQLKETIHKLQQRDASQRLEIAKLKRLLLERNQEYKLVSEQLQDLQRVQQRNNQYILKIDNYVVKLKQKLQKASIKIESLESKFSSSRVKQNNIIIDESFNVNDSFQTEHSPISTKYPILKQTSNRSNQAHSVNKPKLICKPIKVQMPYPNKSYTENQEILENNSLIKPCPLQEQILNRILDDEEFMNNFSNQFDQMQTDLFSYQKSQTQPLSFSCNSRQSNFSFVNSEKKQNWNDKQYKQPNRQYHSISIEEKENNSKYFN